jgi:hypothetical protein
VIFIQFVNLQSLEATRLTYSLKDKQRCSEANLRIQELNESFARDIEKKLAEKMELSAENKNLRINTLQERLKEHVGYLTVFDI